MVPSLLSLSASKQEILTNKDSVKIVPTVIFGTDKELTDSQKETFQNWLKARLKVDTSELLDRSKTPK